MVGGIAYAAYSLIIVVRLDLVLIERDAEGSERSGVSPVECAYGINAFTAAESRLTAEEVFGSLCIGVVFLVTSCNIQLTCCPVKFIRGVIIAVSAAAYRFIERSVHGRMLLCGIVCALCSIETLGGKIVIYTLPKTSCLSRTCSEIERCSRCGRLYNTFEIIICGSYRKRRPLVVMYLVVDHILVFAAVNDHLEHPFHFPASLVKKIGSIIAAFGDEHSAVTVDILKSVFDSSFVLVLHQPERETSVYNILSVVACIVPAA